MVADLEPLGLLKNSDRSVLVAHCEAWSRFVAAVREYHREGVVKLNPDSGRTGKHAAASYPTMARGSTYTSPGEISTLNRLVSRLTRTATEPAGWMRAHGTTSHMPPGAVSVCVGHPCTGCCQTPYRHQRAIMAEPEMSRATLARRAGPPGPAAAAEGGRMARYRYIAAVNAKSLELQ